MMFNGYPCDCDNKIFRGSCLCKKTFSRFDNEKLTNGAYVTHNLEVVLKLDHQSFKIDMGGADPAEIFEDKKQRAFWFAEQINLALQRTFNNMLKLDQPLKQLPMPKNDAEFRELYVLNPEQHKQLVAGDLSANEMRSTAVCRRCGSPLHHVSDCEEGLS